jgi:hypothetical protein
MVRSDQSQNFAGELAVVTAHAVEECLPFVFRPPERLVK